MNQVLTLEKPLQRGKLKHPFLQELIEQIRLADTFSAYCHWTDELLVEKLAIALEKRTADLQNHNLDSLYQILAKAFYQAIGNNIQQRTGHTTETHIHIRNKKICSAVIFCGGVLVFNSLISGYKNCKSISLQELIIKAEHNICHAVAKASHYLDF